MTSFLQKCEAEAGFYWKTEIKGGKAGIRIAVRKKGFINPDSAGTKDEVGYIHVVPTEGKWYSVLNVEIADQFRNKGLGKDLYRRAAIEIGKQGGHGVVSLAGERTPEATHLWKSLKEAEKDKGGTWILQSPQS